MNWFPEATLDVIRAAAKEPVTLGPVHQVGADGNAGNMVHAAMTALLLAQGQYALWSSAGGYTFVPDSQPNGAGPGVLTSGQATRLMSSLVAAASLATSAAQSIASKNSNASRYAQVAAQQLQLARGQMATLTKWLVCPASGGSTVCSLGEPGILLCQAIAAEVAQAVSLAQQALAAPQAVQTAQPKSPPHLMAIRAR